jgi:hypothetical protein
VKKDDLFLTAKELAARHQGDGGRARLFPHRVPGRKFEVYASKMIDDYDATSGATRRATKAVDGKQANDSKKL